MASGAGERWSVGVLVAGDEIDRCQSVADAVSGMLSIWWEETAAWACEVRDDGKLACVMLSGAAVETAERVTGTVTVCHVGGAVEQYVVSYILDAKGHFERCEVEPQSAAICGWEHV
jgi:hypothetical protein